MDVDEIERDGEKGKSKAGDDKKAKSASRIVKLSGDDYIASDKEDDGLTEVAKRTTKHVLQDYCFVDHTTDDQASEVQLADQAGPINMALVRWSEAEHAENIQLRADKSDLISYVHDMVQIIAKTDSGAAAALVARLLPTNVVLAKAMAARDAQMATESYRMDFEKKMMFMQQNTLNINFTINNYPAHPQAPPTPASATFPQSPQMIHDLPLLVHFKETLDRTQHQLLAQIFSVVKL